MLGAQIVSRSPYRAIGVALAVLAINLLAKESATAQNGGVALFPTNQVGGVMVDAEGVVNHVALDDLGRLGAARRRAMQSLDDDLARPAELRKISLRRLMQAIRENQHKATPLSDEMLLLAGLQQVRYVFVFPQEKDIVLAGPGEGWKVDELGEVVGITTGRPVMQLDDLLVVWRATVSMREEISCSIDPTSDGVLRLREFVKTAGPVGPRVQATLASIEQTLGPQTITVTGVPPSSHFAGVMVAADYRMKRLAMNFEPAPVEGMPSYLHLVSANGRGMSNMMPRWWLAPDYEPILRDPAGLAWELRGAGVKVMTEEDFVTATGARQASGQASLAARKWADSMTAHYDELAVRLPVFGQLQALVDLAVVAALIHKEDLAAKAGCDLSLLTSATELPTRDVHAPRQVASVASFIKRGRNYIISASGGVRIPSWSMVEGAQESAQPEAARQAATSTQPNHWWWN